MQRICRYAAHMQAAYMRICHICSIHAYIPHMQHICICSVYAHMHICSVYALLSSKLFACVAYPAYNAYSAYPPSLAYSTHAPYAAYAAYPAYAYKRPICHICSMSCICVYAYVRICHICSIHAYIPHMQHICTCSVYAHMHICSEYAHMQHICMQHTCVYATYAA